jgi:hypothetical protein
MYVIPFTAASEAEVIPVGDELGVAEYFLVEDDASTPWQRLCYAVASDLLLGMVCRRLFNFDPRGAYLRHIFRRLEDGMDSAFFWGHEGKVKRHFAPLPYGHGDKVA